MVAWNEFAALAPELAEQGQRLFTRTGSGEALIATVRDDLPPRVHPVNIAIVDGCLLAFVIVGSGKLADLAADGRYALHAHQDPAVPHEFQVRGRAREVTDAAQRAAAAAVWPFEVDDGYRLFDFSVEHAVFGERGSADDWPPVYRSWKAGPRS
jgi:Pyridoxamine 5'-phosphate oxidase